MLKSIYYLKEIFNQCINFTNMSSCNDVTDGLLFYTNVPIERAFHLLQTIHSHLNTLSESDYNFSNMACVDYCGLSVWIIVVTSLQLIRQRLPKILDASR